MKYVLVVVVGVAVAIAGAAVAARGDVLAEEALPSDVARYQDFRPFELYYPGLEFEGLPLVHVEERNDTPTAEEPLVGRWVTFVYGECEPGVEGRCAPPLQVQVWPASLRNRDVQPFAPDREPDVRGVPAAFYGDRLELETGRSTVVLFGSDRAQLLRAASALRGINVGVGPGDRLPPAAR